MDYLQLFSSGAAASPSLASSHLSTAFDDLRKANAQLQAQLHGAEDNAPEDAQLKSVSTPASVTRMSRHFASPRGKASLQVAKPVTSSASPHRPPLIPAQQPKRVETAQSEPSYNIHPQQFASSALSALSTVSATAADRPPLPSLPPSVPPHNDTPLAPTAPASSLYQAAQAWRAAAAYSEAKAAAAAAGAAEHAAQASHAQTEAEHLQTALRAAQDQQADTMRQHQNCEAEVRVLRMHLQALQASDGADGASSDAGGDTGAAEDSPSPAALAQLHGLLEAAHVEVEALRGELARARQQREDASGRLAALRGQGAPAAGRQQEQEQAARQAQAVALVADEQVRQLREECAELQRRIAAAGGLADVETLREELQTAQSEGAACRAHNEELLETLEGVQESLASLTGAVRASEAAAAASASDASRSEQLQTELRAQVEDAQAEMQAQRKRADTAEEQVQLLQRRVEALTASAAADASVIASLKRQLQSVSTELDATLSNHEEHMQSMARSASPPLAAAAKGTPPPRPRSLGASPPDGAADATSGSAAQSSQAKPPHITASPPDRPTVESPASRAALLRTASPLQGGDSPPRAPSPLATRHEKPAAQKSMQLAASSAATHSIAAVTPSASAASGGQGGAEAPDTVSAATPRTPPSHQAAKGGAGEPTTAATAFTIESGQPVDPDKAAFMELKRQRAEVQAALEAAAAPQDAPPSEQGMAAAAARSRARARAAAAAAQREVSHGSDGGGGRGRGASPPMTPTARVVADNHKRLRNALSRVLLAAEAHTAPLAHALDAIDAHDGAYIVACFVSGHSTVRGRFLSLLAMNEECTVGRRIWGKGPRSVTRDMMRTQYKFDTVSRDFVRLSVGDFSFVSDGVGVDAALVKVAGLKAPSLSTHSMRGDVSVAQAGGTVDLGSDSDGDSQRGMDEMLLM